MDIKKITVDQREIIKKHRISINSTVSMWHDEFSCGALGQNLNSIMDQIMKPDKKLRNTTPYGVGKREIRVSMRYLVDIYKSDIDGSDY